MTNPFRDAPFQKKLHAELARTCGDEAPFIGLNFDGPIAPDEFLGTLGAIPMAPAVRRSTTD